MKKFFVFTASFILIYLAVQLMLGLFLPVAYIPSPLSEANDAGQQVLFGNATNSFWSAFLSAIAAYIVSQKSFGIDVQRES